MDFIFVHGAPGSGKSSVGQALQAKLKSPWFEFGWIPEFRHKREILLSYAEEESFSFDTLCLVIKNYARHGFDPVIVSDLRDPKIRQLPRRFARYQYLLVTLWLDDDELLKARVLNETRSSAYRNWQGALELNRKIQARPLMNRELRLNAAHFSVADIVEQILSVDAASLPAKRRLPPPSAFCD